MLILRVGDPHVQVANLDESLKLFKFIYDTAKKFKVDRIELLGDLYHNHAIKRVEVEAFWDRMLYTLSEDFHTVVLLGNHDMANQKLSHSENSLDVHKRLNCENLEIITTPTLIGNIGYMPYVHDPKEFVEDANLLKANLLVCHQTFDGAKYDNGFYAPDGIDAGLLLHPAIISGHIHMEATYGKVWYPGTAKWDTASDANQQKGIWICEHSDDGSLVNKTFLSTWGIVTPIMSYVWQEGEPAPTIPDGVIASIELVGSNTFVSKSKSLFKGTKTKIKTKITDKVVRENRKASASVLDFLENSYKTSIDKEKLKAYLKEKNYV